MNGRRKKLNLRFSITLWSICILMGTNVYSQPQEKPKLVLMISVDQMSPDYFERFSAIFHGGFRKLATEGMVYKNCSLEYAYTETGPGHATMSTGCFPFKHGIFLNDWYDPRNYAKIYCVRDSLARPVEGLGGYASPRNLAVTTIGDWLKASSPLSRVVSLSVKDRAAVLMGGQRPDVVSWYSKDEGKFVSSSYYDKRLPGFVKRFNEKNFLQWVPPVWERLNSECDPATGPDTMDGEQTRLGGSTAFPHPLPDSLKASLLQFTPYGDSILLALAMDAVTDMRLGKSGQPDLLCIGLSCTDYIGHYFGPNSVEMCDHLKRLDESLGKFLESVEQFVGKENLVVVLTSDHSVQPLPEYSTRYLHKEMHRLIDVEDIEPALKRADSILRQTLHIDEPLINPHGFLGYRVADSAGLTVPGFENEVRKVLKDIKFVRDVFFRHELVSAERDTRPHLAEFRRSYYAEQGPDFLIDFKDDYLTTEKDYPVNHDLFCMHVPLILWSQHIDHVEIHRKVMSVDIAPTLARILGVPVPSWLDGKPLKEVVQKFDNNASSDK